MSTKLIIITDLQRFKLFGSKIDPMGRESLDLLQSIDSLETHLRIREKVSDRQGNFHGIGGSGSGEDHNLGLEEERRRIKEIAQEISNALAEHAHEEWYLAAPKAINNQIVELLSAEAKSKMTINLHSDLTKIPDDQLLKHFVKEA